MPEHSFIRYWRYGYAHRLLDHADALQFQQPQMSHPLLSPFFITGQLTPALRKHNPTHFNLVTRDAERARKVAAAHGYRPSRHFKMVERPPVVSADQPDAVYICPMAETIQQPWFWELLSLSFPADVDFQKRLLPFLIRSGPAFWTVWLVKDKRPAALLNIGVAGGVALGLTAAVHPGFRRRGLTRELAAAASNFAVQRGLKSAVYWTEHEFLLPEAPCVWDYLIFQKD